ncbi:hypothetical protein CBM2637_A150042 [Cupriavidus taiwanensis]|uniref:hypothetical protein n=1 Tax=Cupriavidus taiwanensis TaxID=164546 RepID=UPI000E12E053|nr:hypothetical protein [Cupriavidus taiwanensis]SPA24589.1 hypothetical protein CBM2637_A150042 [Cupriavidus taiwanensis]
MADFVISLQDSVDTSKVVELQIGNYIQGAPGMKGDKGDTGDVTPAATAAANAAAASATAAATSEANAATAATNAANAVGNSLRADLASTSDATKGAGMVGYSGSTVKDALDKINNGTATDAGALTGAEISPLSRGSGVLKTTLTAIALWMLQTYQGFTHTVTGAVARTLRDKSADTLNAEDLGVTAGAANNAPAFNLAVATDKVSDLRDSEYQVSALIGSPSIGAKFRGRSRYKSKIKQTSATFSGVIQSVGATGVDIRDLTLDVSATGASATSHPLTLLDVNDASVRSVNINGITGTGSAVLAYPSSESAFVDHVRLEDMKVTGNLADASNTNGPLIVNGRYAMMHRIYADNILEYAVEYKNLTYWSLISDVIVNNSGNGVSFGQTTPDASGVSYCAVSNFVAKDCGQGIVVGKGGYNAMSNGVVHIQTPFSAQKIGLRTSGSTVGNSFSNMLMVGDVQEAVRLGSQRNYVSASIHSENTAVTLESGAAGNVVEIQHPGARTSIFGSPILDVSGQSVSGSNSNPIYCHATGEYRGILSARWRWQHASSGASAQASSHKWVFEGAGDSVINVLTDGTGSGGFSTSMSGATRSMLYNWPGGYWQLSVGTAGYRFFPTVFRMEADNATDIGSASLRFKSTYSREFRPGGGTPIWTSGAGTPEGVVTAPVGSMYTRTDGGAATTLYVKESGIGNTGWVAK